MNDTSFFMQIQQGLGDLGNDVATEILTEVRQADDLMEQFTART